MAEKKITMTVPVDIGSNRHFTELWVSSNLSYLSKELQNELVSALIKKYEDKSPETLAPLTFGKYKGRTVDEVVKLDFNYTAWIIRTEPSAISSDQMDRMLKLFNDYNCFANPMLQTAHYTHPLYAEFCKYVDEKMLASGIVLLNDFKNPYDEVLQGNPIGENKICGEYTLTVRLPEKFSELKRNYDEFVATNGSETLPSRHYLNELLICHLRNSVHCVTVLNDYWVLELDNSIKDADETTELDRCWKMCVENIERILEHDGSIASTTSRPYKIKNNRNGYIRIYCSDCYKTETINRFRELYKYDKPIYWRKKSKKTDVTQFHPDLLCEFEHIESPDHISYP
jgi:hypothetical protein